MDPHNGAEGDTSPTLQQLLDEALPPEGKNLSLSFPAIRDFLTALVKTVEDKNAHTTTKEGDLPPPENGVQNKKQFNKILNNLLIQDENQETRLEPVVEEDNDIDAVRGLHETIRQGVRAWVETNKNKGSKATSLSDTLRKQGFSKMAEYVETCLEEQSERHITSGDSGIGSETDESTKPLIPESPKEDVAVDIKVAETTPHDFRAIKCMPPNFIQNWIPLTCGGVVLLLLGSVLGIWITMLFVGAGTSTEKVLQSNITSTELRTTEITVAAELSSEENFPPPTPPGNINKGPKCIPRRDSPYSAPSGSNPQWAKFIANFDNAEINLCALHSNEITLVLEEGRVGNTLPSFRCPENVLGIDIRTSIREELLNELLSTLCSLQTIAFMGKESCPSLKRDFKPSTTINPTSVDLLRFESILECTSPYKWVERIGLNVTNIEFSCISFTSKSNNYVQTMVNSLSKINSVSCDSSDNCASFDVRLPRGTKLKTKYAKCSGT